MAQALGRLSLLRNEPPGNWGLAITSDERTVFGFSARWHDHSPTMFIEITPDGAVQTDHVGVFYVFDEAWILPDFMTAHRRSFQPGDIGFTADGHILGFAKPSGDLAMVDIETGAARDIGARPSGVFSKWSLCLGSLLSHMTLYHRP